MVTMQQLDLDHEEDSDIDILFPEPTARSAVPGNTISGRGY